MEYNTPLNEPEAYDEALDRMVDSGVYSYELARFVLGMPPYEIDITYGAGLNEDSTSSEDVVTKALESYAVSTEPEAAYNHLLSGDLPPAQPKSPEQLHRDRQGRERVRRAMSEARAA